MAMNVVRPPMSSRRTVVWFSARWKMRSSNLSPSEKIETIGSRERAVNEVGLRAEHHLPLWMKRKASLPKCGRPLGFVEADPSRNSRDRSGTFYFFGKQAYVGGC